jgi:glycosyltransferase involved in cell wall biosynthesis
MAHTVAVITPAYKAQDTLPTTVRSVLDQTHADWQHWIIADDGFDYAGFLAEQDLADPRQVFLSAGAHRSRAMWRWIGSKRPMPPFSMPMTA